MSYRNKIQVDTVSANYFLAGPNGSTGAPGFRTIASADINTALTTPGPIGSGTANSGTFTTGTFSGAVKSSSSVYVDDGTNGKLIMANSATENYLSSYTTGQAAGKQLCLLVANVFRVVDTGFVAEWLRMTQNAATFGNTTGQGSLLVNGIGSGTAGGSYVGAQAGSTTVIAIGNASALYGGAYNAAPMLWAGSSINIPSGFNTTAVCSTGALSSTDGTFSGSISAVSGTLSGELIGTGTTQGLTMRGNGSIYDFCITNYNDTTYVMTVPHGTVNCTFYGATTINGGVSSTTGTFSGQLAANSGAASSSTITGALVVNGGVGISGNCYVGYAIYAAGGATITGAITGQTSLVIQRPSVPANYLTISMDTNNYIGYAATNGAYHYFTGAPIVAAGAITSLISVNGAIFRGGISNDNATSLSISGGTSGITAITGTLTVSGKITSVAATTATASVNIPNGAAPTTPVTGDIWAVSGDLFYYNGSVTSNLLPMTTAGDIIYGGASGIPTRLGVSTNGYVLTLVSGNPAWAASTASINSTNYTTSGTYYPLFALTQSGAASTYSVSTLTFNPATGILSVPAISSTVSFVISGSTAYGYYGSTTITATGTSSTAQYGSYEVLSYNSAFAATGAFIGNYVGISLGSSGITNSAAYGNQISITVATSSTISNAYGIYLTTSSTGGTISTMYGLYMSQAGFTGTMTTHYGIYLIGPNSGTTSYGLYVASMNSTTSYVLYGAGTGQIKLLDTTATTAYNLGSITTAGGIGAAGSIISNKAIAASGIGTYSPAASGSFTIDCTLGNLFYITLPATASTVTMNAPTGMVNGQSLNIILLQGAAATTLSASSTTFKFAGGAKTLGAAGTINLISMVYYSTGSYWACSMATALA